MTIAETNVYVAINRNDCVNTLDQFFVGRDDAPTGQHLVVGVALFVLVVVAHAPPAVVGPLSYPFGLRLWPLALLGVGGGLLAALRGDGIVGALAMGGDPVLGFFTALGLTELTTPSMGVAQGIATGFVAGGLLAGVGFVLGFAGRYVAVSVADSGGW